MSLIRVFFHVYCPLPFLMPHSICLIPTMAFSAPQPSLGATDVTPADAVASATLSYPVYDEATFPRHLLAVGSIGLPLADFVHCFLCLFIAQFSNVNAYTRGCQCCFVTLWHILVMLLVFCDVCVCDVHETCTEGVFLCLTFLEHWRCRSCAEFIIMVNLSPGGGGLTGG